MSELLSCEGLDAYPRTDAPTTAKSGPTPSIGKSPYAGWLSGVRALDSAGLAEPCGPAEGPYAAMPMATLVLHINREVFHHLAEVALLRDLWAHRDPVE